MPTPAPSLLQAGATAGWDRNFFLASSDGNYLLKISGQLQASFVYSAGYRADARGSDGQVVFRSQLQLLF